jgi:GH15 family glucan-1,4-alpha-glucosidase
MARKTVVPLVDDHDQSEADETVEHLSEQFDKVTGFEKSVQDLTWSYAAYLSAVRTRP